MDAKLDQPSGRAATAAQSTTRRRAEQGIGIYWLLASVGGALFLWDWISAWNVSATLSRQGLIVYLILSFALSQLMYAFVARHDGRRFELGPAVIFALGNGIAETLAFALVYRLGETIGAWAMGLLVPAWASVAGFGLGVALFVIYGGLIHALFWLRVLPPHLDDAPRSRRIRKLRPIAEIALVLGWSLCFWLSRDLWSVVFFHILVDVGLMLKVRPALFGAVARKP